MHFRLRQVFGEKVTWVLLAEYFLELNFTGANLFLDPEILRAEVPDVASTPSARYANGCYGIAQQDDLKVNTEVSCKVLEA